MLRKNYYTFLLATALFLTSGLAVLAQTAPIRGKVELVKADGTKEPVAGAIVEPFRTDAKGKSPSAKTNKKGEFSFAGLQLGQIFVLSISAPNIKPALQPGIKAGMENIAVTVEEGDGKRWTEDEVRQALSAPATTTSTTASANTASGSGTEKVELSADQKKAQAEYEAKVKDITAKNENIKQKTAIVESSLKAGNEAFNSKNYDIAITKYSEGIEADPDFVGTAPILLNNKGAALRIRATETYNQAVKSSDAAAKTSFLVKVKQDLQDAVTSYTNSWTILKAAQPTDIPNQANYEATKLQTLTGLTDAHRLLVLTKSDTSKSAEAKTAFADYLTIETDAAKKAKAQIVLGDIMREAGDSTSAIEAYRAALATSPDNADAMAGLGLSLFNSGVVSDDKAQMQEGLNFMEKFAQAAPETHPLKSSVKDAVTYLKTEQKLTPQKVTTTKKRN
jgi:tetratricopeptide (TPR) repeat protein